MNTDLLRRLCETPGIPGREERVRALIQKEVKGLFDAAEVDPLGALICRRAPTTGKYKGKVNAGATKVMLACHMDEIGFYVTHIDDQGFIRLNAAAKTISSSIHYVCFLVGPIQLLIRITHNS